MNLNPYISHEQYANEWLPVSAINGMNIEYPKEKLLNAVVVNSMDKRKDFNTTSWIASVRLR